MASYECKDSQYALGFEEMDVDERWRLSVALQFGQDDENFFKRPNSHPNP